MDRERIVELLARQEALWASGTQVCYHPLTFGWLCDELVRRVDGRSVGRFFADEVAAPLGLDVWIGLPVHLETRVSKLGLGDGWGKSPQFNDRRLRDDAVLASVWANPPVFTTDWHVWNTTRFHTAEIPGANAIGTARSMATLYGCLAQGGCFRGTKLLTSDTIEASRNVVANGFDPLARETVAFGLGFQLQTSAKPFGPAQDGFGHGGAGGSIHGAWPGLGVGFSYAMNEMRDDEPDHRATALLEALSIAVERTASKAREESVHGAHNVYGNDHAPL
jgi:CubicO group peptidase (beta-lactamase class C family)